MSVPLGQRFDGIQRDQRGDRVFPGQRHDDLTTPAGDVRKQVRSDITFDVDRD